MNQVLPVDFTPIDICKYSINYRVFTTIQRVVGLGISEPSTGTVSFLSNLTAFHGCQGKIVDLYLPRNLAF